MDVLAIKEIQRNEKVQTFIDALVLLVPERDRKAI